MTDGPLGTQELVEVSESRGILGLKLSKIEPCRRDNRR